MQKNMTKWQSAEYIDRTQPSTTLQIRISLRLTSTSGKPGFMLLERCRNREINHPFRSLRLTAHQKTGKEIIMVTTATTIIPIRSTPKSSPDSAFHTGIRLSDT